MSYIIGRVWLGDFGMGAGSTPTPQIWLDGTRWHYVLVTNKLLIETTDEDPKVRLKALELLGKTARGWVI
jgi:hypothetical protein